MEAVKIKIPPKLRRGGQEDKFIYSPGVWIQNLLSYGSKRYDIKPEWRLMVNIKYKNDDMYMISTELLAMVCRLE
jgi:hypothetical protein